MPRPLPEASRNDTACGCVQTRADVVRDGFLAGRRRIATSASSFIGMVTLVMAVAAPARNRSPVEATIPTM